MSRAAYFRRLRAALVVAGSVLAPSLLLFVRAGRQGFAAQEDVASAPELLEEGSTLSK